MEYYENINFGDAFKDLKGQHDLLQLLSSGLKEGQPWAVTFADTVLKDLASRIKNIKITSTPIVIDGESISDEINKNIKDGVSKDIDQTVETIRKEIVDSGKAMTVKTDKNPLDFSSMLGQTPKLNFANKIRFQSLTRNILDRIEKGLPDKIDFKKNGISLGEIFRPPGDSSKFSVSALGITAKWNRLQKKIIDALDEGVPSSIGFAFKQGVPLSEVFRPPGLQTTFMPSALGITAKWNKLQKKIIDALDTGVPSFVGFGFKQGVPLSEIFRPPGKQTAFMPSALGTTAKWNKLQKKIIDAIDAGIPEKFSFKQGMSISQIFQPPGNTTKFITSATLTWWKWWNIQHKLLKNIEAAIPEKFAFKKTLSLNDIMGIDAKTGMSARLRWSILQKDLIERTEAAIKKMDITPAIKEKQPRTPDGRFAPKIEPKRNEFKSLEEKEPLVKVSGFTKNALKDLSSLPGLSKITKQENAPKKESKKMSGLGILATLGLVGLGLLAGGITAQITSIFKDGPFKGLQKAIGNVMMHVGAYLSKTFAPFLEKHITKIFKGISTSLAKLVGMFSKTASKTVLSVGKTASTKLLKFGGTFLKGALKKLPIIGSIIGLGSAFSRIIKGDFIGGLLDVGSAIASLVPVAGTAIAIAIDVFSAGRDLKTGGSAKASQSGANQKINKFLTEKLENVPVVGKFIRLSKGLGALSAGNWKMAGMYLASVVPGISWIFNKDTLDKAAISAPTKSFTQMIMDALKIKIKNILRLLPEFVKNPIYKMFGIKEDPVKKDDAIKPIPVSKNIDNAKKETSVKVAQTTQLETNKIFKPANSFVWRKGSDVQKFNPKNSVVETKDDRMILKLAAAIKEKQEPNKQKDPMMEQLHTDVDKLLKRMGNVMDTLVFTSNKTNKSSTPASARGELAGISDNAGDVRDPAYILRSRAWDRLRKGYVVI